VLAGRFLLEVLTLIDANTPHLIGHPEQKLFLLDMATGIASGPFLTIKPVGTPYVELEFENDKLYFLAKGPVHLGGLDGSVVGVATDMVVVNVPNPFTTLTAESGTSR